MNGRTGRRCKPHLPVCLLACLSGGVLCLPLRAQERQPNSETQQTTPAGSAKPDTPKAKDRDVSWRTLPQNFLQDQKEIWLFPTQLAKGRHWLPVVGVTGATAILIAADGHDTPYFRRTGSFEGFNDAFSGRITGAGIALVPVVFLVGGHFRKDSYAEKTALLAGEAYANGAIMEIALKMTTRRLRSLATPRVFHPDIQRRRLPLRRCSHIVTAGIAGCPGWLTARPLRLGFQGSPCNRTFHRTCFWERRWAFRSASL
jgi:hypothetical protein